jgi:hypothetical protein
MQLKGIIAGAFLLIVYAVGSIPNAGQMDLGWLGKYSIPNPLYAVFNASIVHIPWVNFNVTLNWIFLGLAFICILMGLFSSGGKKQK